MNDTDHLPILSSVVLLRLIDYAKRPVAEQARLNAQLDTILALLLPDMPEQSRIVLSGAGSIAIAVLNNPLAALAFAERALLANQIGLNLCIGIDHGPIEVASSASGDILAGDGIATASVIAAFSTTTGLLVSQSFRTAYAQMSPGAENLLVPTANFSDAGLRTYNVFTLDRQAPSRRRRRLLLLGAGLAGLLLLSAMTIRYTLPNRPQPLAIYFDELTSVAPIAAPERPKIEHPKNEHPKRAPYGNFWK